jgi:hypothetical protein
MTTGAHRMPEDVMRCRICCGVSVSVPTPATPCQDGEVPNEDAAADVTSSRRTSCGDAADE